MSGKIGSDRGDEIVRHQALIATLRARRLPTDMATKILQKLIESQNAITTRTGCGPETVRHELLAQPAAPPVVMKQHYSTSIPEATSMQATH